FDFEAALPKNANLGWARVELSAIGADDANGIRTNHNFQIQEFRRPKFEVTAKGSQGPHLVGASAEVTVSAKYFAGGALPGAPVNWSVNASPASFTPPNRSDYTFGTWVPWWRSHYEGGGSHQRFEGTTDGKGDHRIRLDFTKVDPPRPTTVTATANVEDVDRQSWSAAATLLVHPSLRYVGVRTESTFVDPGDEVKIETIVTDLDGALLAGETVKFTADRLAWTFTKGEWSEEVKETIEGEASSLADGPATFAFTPKAGGRFRVRAQVADDQDRPNQSELTIWVSGGDQPSLDRVELEEATLIPSGETFQPGDTARILVQSPFTPAEGLLTLRRNGIVRAERFQMDAPTKVLEVKIDESHLPGVTVQVELVGQAERAVAAQTTKEIPARPAFARGSLRLKVPPTSRTLTVEAKPRETELEPGGETTIDLTVRDAQGRPVKDAEALVVVVDEAILSLTGYRLPDPMNTFYPARGAGTRDQDVRGFVKLASLAELEEVGSADDNDATAVFDAEAMSDGASGGEMAGAAPPGAPMASARAMRKNGKGRGAAQPAIRVRKDLRALALFAPAVRTDADGAASVAVKLPDSLTRYRVMVIAASGDKQFGKSEATITARMPLMVRPSPPRFLSYGDRAELPIVVHNQTKDPITVEVSLRVTNLGVELPGGGTADQAGRRIEVPAKDRVEVRFPIVARKPGTARFQVAAVAGGYADAAERDFPVWTPATTEGFATYGVLDEEWATYNIQAPADAVTEFGGLTIETSSTQLQALTDAVVYLVDYPYSCTEQISSRVLAIAALRDVLAAFQAEGLPGADDLALAMEEDLSELSRRQNGDGSFGFWRRGGRDWPYLTIHAAHAATRAGDKGFNVPKRLLDRSKKYLREIRSHLDPKWSLAVRQSMEAYALYVRHRMGDSDADAIYRLIKEAGGIKKLPIEALGFCVTALADAGETGDVIEEALRYFQNQVTETAGAAQFTASYSDGAHLILHTARRTDAILLESVMAADPKSDLIPKLVRGLLAHKKKGRWGNTQENCFILLSLDRYFRAYEKATPDFVAQAWLGDGYAGERTYQGRETVNHTVNVPMAALVDPEGQSQALVLRKKGEGRLYYRLGLRYAPRSLDLEPMERGFVVQRRYEALDDPADVSRDEDGTWRIRAGARVRVRLGMVAQARRYHVALVDPLPAGLEPVNPALAVSRADGADPGSQARVGRHWWWGPWYEHQNLRDERAEAFASIVYGGVYEYSYVARATTPGHFVAAPAKAEEMYSPDVFGRSGTDKVIVE
ncbi:MAG: alpha-2-macroglobulin family protein, partial [Planctomycetota bacterium]